MFPLRRRMLHNNLMNALQFSRIMTTSASSPNSSVSAAYVLELKQSELGYVIPLTSPEAISFDRPIYILGLDFDISKGVFLFSAAGHPLSLIRQTLGR